MASIGAPSRRKIAKIEPIEAILKINFRHLFPNPWSIWAKTGSVATGQLLDQNELKLCWLEIQDYRHSRHLEKSVLDIFSQTTRRIKLKLTM